MELAHAARDSSQFDARERLFGILDHGGIWVPNPKQDVSTRFSVYLADKLTLAMSLATLSEASSMSCTIVSSPTRIDPSAKSVCVIRSSSLCRKEWSILSSEGAPAARKELYKPVSH